MYLSLVLMVVVGYGSCVVSNGGRAHRYLQHRNSTDTNGTVTIAYRATSCDDGWIAFNGSCFMVGRTQETWATAKLNCENFKATLWVVGSKDEWDAMRLFAYRISWNWIGVSWQIGASGPTWVTGVDTVSFSPEMLPWLVASGSHGYTNAANCVAYFHDASNLAHPSSYVSYYPCSNKNYFICKKAATKATTTATDGNSAAGNSTDTANATRYQ